MAETFSVPALLCPSCPASWRGGPACPLGPALWAQTEGPLPLSTFSPGIGPSCPILQGSLESGPRLTGV